MTTALTMVDNDVDREGREGKRWAPRHRPIPNPCQLRGVHGLRDPGPAGGRMAAPAELTDGALVQDKVQGKDADTIVCPMCQTPLPGLGKPYGRVYHGIQCLMEMNERLGTPVQEPFDFKDCSHSGKCEVACIIVKDWCALYGPCACVHKALERGWWMHGAGEMCAGSMNYKKGCDCV